MRIAKILFTFEGMLLVVMFCTIVGWMPLTDNDFFWHLKNGEVLIQTKMLFHTDIFSHTAFGEPIQITGWFFDVLLAYTYGIAGEYGIRIMIATFCGTTLIGVFKSCNLYIDRKPVCAILAILTFILLMPGLAPRPNLFTNCALAWSIYFVLKYCKSNQIKYLLAIIPLFAVWSNFHYGFAAAAAIIVIIYCAAVLDKFAPISTEQPLESLLRKEALLVFVLALLAVGLNPFGLQVYLELYEMTSRGSVSPVAEWQSPNFHRMWQKPLLVSILVFMLLIFIGWRRTSWLQILLPAVLIAGSLISARHQLFWAVIFPIIVSMCIPNISKDGKVVMPGVSVSALDVPTKNKSDYIFNGILMVAALASLVIKIYWNEGELDKSSDTLLPIRAVDFMIEEIPTGKLYNNYDSGGYIIWKGYPEFKVFVDGRYFPYQDSFLAEALHVSQGKPGSIDILQKYNVEISIVNTGSALSELLFLNEDFRIVYADEKHSIYTLDNEKYRGLATVERSPVAKKVEDLAS